MVLARAGAQLQQLDLPRPAPERAQVLLRVLACGVCRTDLHIVDGELPGAVLPIVPGHEIIGTVVEAGADAIWPVGTRLGVPWLAGSCGHCMDCRSGHENLCDRARFMGFHVNGGYADYALANGDYCFEIPAQYSDVAAAPLMCAGLIGLRALRMAAEPRRVGFYGFGAAAHILAQIARHEGREVYAFTRPDDAPAQQLARSLGAVWAGSSLERPPEPLDAAIVFAPDGALVPLALRAVRKAGSVICAGIHMSPIPSFSYDLLWGERVLRSVANLTRRDGIEFFRLAQQLHLRTAVQVFDLTRANEAMQALRSGAVHGAAVLTTAV